MEIYFATGNKHKFQEAQEIMQEKEIELKHFEFKHNEIRSDSIEEIALEAVQKAYEKLKKPVFVDDTGLFLEAYEGFPGTYSAWIQEKLGNKGIIKLLEGKSKNAAFKCCIAYKNDQMEKTFLGVVKGKITTEEIGKNGFGYDPIFIPDGKSQTFGQSINLKKALSHRYKAINALMSYILMK